MADGGDPEHDTPWTYEAYERLHLLGKGNMGSATLVRDKESDELYVLKEVDMTGFSESDVRHTQSEVRVLVSAGHPNIVRHKESWVDGDNVVIVMEYCDGGDLETLMREQRRRGQYFKERVILDFFVQICLALKHLHDRKILHRDLKTQNVFLTSGNWVKLGDFGLSTVLDSTMAQAQSRVGTPYYMSPEICQGVPYDAKSDMWALGCVLYKLCALKHMFSGATLQELIQNITTGPTPKIPKCYSSRIQRVINMLLSKSPEDRPSVNDLLSFPFLQKRVKKFLSTEEYNDEFSHTVLHGHYVPERGGAVRPRDDAGSDDGSDGDDFDIEDDDDVKDDEADELANEKAYDELAKRLQELALESIPDQAP